MGQSQRETPAYVSVIIILLSQYMRKGCLHRSKSSVFDQDSGFNVSVHLTEEDL
jgi:hypothetical protein